MVYRMMRKVLFLGHGNSDEIRGIMRLEEGKMQPPNSKLLPFYCFW